MNARVTHDAGDVAEAIVAEKSLTAGQVGTRFRATTRRCGQHATRKPRSRPAPSAPRADRHPDRTGGQYPQPDQMRGDQHTSVR